MTISLSRFLPPGRFSILAVAALAAIVVFPELASAQEGDAPAPVPLA